MNLSEKQLKIVNTNRSHVVVMAAAAAGKTATMTERVKKLLADGVSPEKIVVITFTNNAANELYERLEKPLGLFIGTIHSYANFLLLSGGVSTGKLLDEENFDGLFDLIKKHRRCVKEVEHLLLDEAQDCDEQQFEFIFDIIQPINYMVIGDARQNIYSFRGTNPNLLIDLSRELGVTTYQLNENYRNGSAILYYAKNIIEKIGYDYKDYSIPMRPVVGEVIEDSLSNRQILNYINRYDNYKDWFILTRTNAQSDQIIDFLNKNEVPCDSFKKAALTNAEISQKMNDNTVKVLTIHTAKGLEAKNVIVIGAKFYNDEERRISYVAATRARDRLFWDRQDRQFAKQKLKISSWE